MNRTLARLGAGPLLLVALALPAEADPTPTPPPAPADELVAGLDDATAALAAEVLERNPDVARARARAVAAELRAPQLRSLDDPMAALTLFLLPPETRVGPQRFTVSVSQKFPWFGKLALREQAALYRAAAARAELEAERLRVLTEARSRLAELWFLDRHLEIAGEEREHLVRHEEAARARYTAGMGPQQWVVKIQAEITRAEERLLEIERRRWSVLAAINALRDRPADAPVDAPEPPVPAAPEWRLDELRELAERSKPELHAAAARVAARSAEVELAAKNFRPDFTVGVGYTFVDRRQDDPGRANPPPDNGDDVLALSAGVNLPVRRGRLEAALEESLELRRMEEAAERRVRSEIERELGDHAARVPLLHRQWTLLQEVLLAQAEEALRSAEAGYAAGTLGALDLLDAEHVLFQVRTSAARTRADHQLFQARLEAAAAAPLDQASPRSEP